MRGEAMEEWIELDSSDVRVSIAGDGRLRVEAELPGQRGEWTEIEGTFSEIETAIVGDIIGHPFLIVRS